MNRTDSYPIDAFITNQPSVEQSPVEIVELKGRGHPDSLADGISETIANFFCNNSKPKIPVYIYSDKVLIIPGEAVPQFGGGKILKPFRVCVPCISNYKIDLSEIENVVYQFLENTLSHFSREYARVKIFPRKPSKHSIAEYAGFQEEFEDTSVAIGYAPLTRTEQLLKRIEMMLNSKQYKCKYPCVGEDIKLLAYRVGSRVKITIACAFIGKFIKDLTHHIRLKQAIIREIEELGNDYAFNLRIEINPDDNPQLNSVYLSVIGSSIEHGDCGMTGRGNRFNGLISPLRPMIIEATAGKNTQNHPAKLLTIVAQKIADEINQQLSVEDVSVFLVGKVGYHIKDLEHIFVRVKRNSTVKKQHILEIVSYWLSRFIDATTQREFYSLADFSA